METKDMRTTDGSLSQFANDRPPTDGTLVTKLKDAGAIMIAKAGMDEYAGGSQRSSYAGPFCNPYANLIRERYGAECRTVRDLAKVHEAMRGYDPKDPITATSIGFAVEAPLDSFTRKTKLTGRRIAIVREMMPALTINDLEGIRVFNEEVVPALRATGVDLVESINPRDVTNGPRDVTNGWAVDDPAIPNIDIQSIVREMVPTLDTQGEATHLFRSQAIREIVARIMADYEVDALVFPYVTMPASILTGTINAIPWLQVDGRPTTSGWNGITDVSGLPSMVVPGRFTKVVYDRTVRGTTSDFAIDPPAIRKFVDLPFGVQFLGKPWSDHVLLEIGAAYEKARGPRVPPAAFGPIPGEP